MTHVVSIGQSPWRHEEMLEALEEFAVLYEKKPIQDNAGGMQAPHLFLAWFALKKLRPGAVVESGVWLGQGTWFFEQACPQARLYCIDTNLNRIQYRSGRATYFDKDFSTLNWNNLPKEETVLFFDDHQNACERVKTAKEFGFKHLIFEDNYPPSRGDCYSLKKALSVSGSKPNPEILQPPKGFTKKIRNILRMQHSARTISSNSTDAEYLRNHLEVYYEFPPVFKTERTRWNDAWDNTNYPTPEPLLQSVRVPFQQIFLDEATSYTWMCYAKLKESTGLIVS